MMIYRLFFWTTDCLVFVCEKQRRCWLRRGVLSRRNEVIYNGVDTEEFCDKWSPEERRSLRNALGFSDADYVIGISAGLRPGKKQLELGGAGALRPQLGISAPAAVISGREMLERDAGRAA